jgi:HEAT repeat protein
VLSLADVGDRRLQEYLRAEWLQKVCEDNFDVAWEEWKRLRQQGHVWLLLDGLDEMSGDALAAIHRDLEQAWAQNLRVVMTCRINQWETAAGGNILTNSFDVYRTLDYSYQTSQGDDQVKQFISKWFADNQKIATQIRTELDTPGKERIKDLVKNPLRLTLLCASWEKDNEALPETQADLYRGFVNYLYKWKAAEFSDEVKLRQELDLALGKLAKAGLNRQPINDGAVRRFRFTASEISELWKELPDTLLPAAKNLGWLNVVGEEAGEAVYAFYHPTFQEYFAACSIDDWDYFLPRGHIDRPILCESGENLYRVFEQEWQQVILLWMGRKNEDIANGLKEEFIEKLTNFQENENNFYRYRAYCLAAICASEFKLAQQDNLIVNQAIKWAFGYFDNEQKVWTDFLYGTKNLAITAIKFSLKKHVSEFLLEVLKQANLSNSFNCPSIITAILRKVKEINIGDKETIAILIEILKRSNLNDLLRFNIIETLGVVDIGNKEAIASLIELLINDDSENQLQANYIAFNILKIIGVGSQQAIIFLTTLLERDNLENKLCCTIVESLGEIGIGNRQAIDSLFKLLERNDLDNWLRYKIAEALGKIDVDNQQAIDILSELLDLLVGIDIFEPIDFNHYICSHVANTFADICLGDERTIAILTARLERSESIDRYCLFALRILEKIGINNQQIIDNLVKLLEQNDLDIFLRYHVARTLGTIDIGNQQAICNLLKLLEQNDLDNSLRYYVAGTLGMIDTGNRQAIDNLVKLLEQNDLDNSLRYHVAKTLGSLDVGNRQAIDNLVKLLEQDDLDNSLRCHVAKTLGTIDIGNRQAIDNLVKLLKMDGLENRIFYSIIIEALETIGADNQQAINILIKLLEPIELLSFEHNLDRIQVIKTLGEISIGNEQAIFCLIALLKQDNLEDVHYINGVEALGKMVVKQKMPSVIRQLRNYVTDEIYKSNYPQFQSCYQILFQCAETLSYPEFHIAWHQTHRR